VRGEAAALETVAQRLDDSFLEAVELFRRCSCGGFQPCSFLYRDS
jgi:hypothetical protein